MRFYTQFTDHKKQNGINTIVIPTSPRKANSAMHDFHTTFTVSFETSSEEAEIMESADECLRKERPTLIVFFVYSNQQSGWFDKLRCYFKSDGPDLKAWRASIGSFADEKNYMMLCEL